MIALVDKSLTTATATLGYYVVMKLECMVNSSLE